MKMISRITIEIAKENNEFGYGYYKDNIKWDIDPIKEEISLMSARYVYIDFLGEEGYYVDFYLSYTLPPFEYRWTLHKRSPATWECSRGIIVPWDARKFRVRTHSSSNESHCPSCTCKLGMMEEKIIELPKIPKFIGENKNKINIPILDSAFISSIAVSWGYEEGFSLGEICTFKKNT